LAIDLFFDDISYKLNCFVNNDKNKEGIKEIADAKGYPTKNATLNFRNDRVKPV
jgi:hypothetical protein